MHPESRRPLVVLMADDDEDDRMLAAKALSGTHRADLRVVEDGAELLRYLRREGEYLDPSASPRPGMILLDLNMPRKSGREALEEIKSDPELRGIPVVVMTTSQSEEDVRVMYGLGAAGYVVKPSTYEELVEAMNTIARYWLEISQLPGERTGP